MRNRRRGFVRVLAALGGSLGLVTAGLVGAPAAQAIAANSIFVEVVADDARDTSQLVVTAERGLTPFGDFETLIIDIDQLPGTVDGIEVTLTIDEGTKQLLPSGIARFVCSEGGQSMTCYFGTDLGIVHAPPLEKETGVRIGFSSVEVYIQTAINAYGPDAPGIEYRGGSGLDSYYGGPSRDRVYGGPGDDELFGGLGMDTIYGEEGDDLIDGELGDDYLDGGPGDDYITGDGDLPANRKGDPDTIIGGPGVDTLDSEDGIADRLVDCENEPGQGGIAFDRGLEYPFACPVLLVPSEPVIDDVSEVGVGIAVEWSPPVFDGNTEVTSYDVEFAPAAGRPIVKSTTETSYVEAMVPGGVWTIRVRAVNSEGNGPWSQPRQIDVSADIAPPTEVRSYFVSGKETKVSWEPSVSGKGLTYEIAMRVKNAKATSWGKWEPIATTKKSAHNMRDVLGLVRKRVYQLRVRAVDGKGGVSTWATSPSRFSDPLRHVDVTGVKANRLFTNFDFKLDPELAQRHNISDITSVEVRNGRNRITQVTWKADGKGFSAVWPAQRQSKVAICTLRVQVAIADSAVKEWFREDFRCGRST